MRFSSWFRGIKGKLLLASMLPILGFTTIGIISFNGASQLTVLLESSHKNIIPSLQ